jgi:two-component system, OmpR family, phosphate regulon sensor histidine kinase PhoR
MVRRVPKKPYLKPLKGLLIASRLQFELGYIFLLRRRGFVLRTLICWAMGCLILVSDEVNSYDYRLQIRGDQPATSEIVLVTLKPSDIPRLQRNKNLLRELEKSESSFWEENLWYHLLNGILLQNPKAIGVTLLFPNWSASLSVNQRINKVLTDPKIFWAAATVGMDRPLLPAFADFRMTNVGAVDFLKDEDGIVRRFYSPSSEYPHLAEKITGVNLVDGWNPRFINFRGSPRVFSQYSASDVLSGRVSAESFKNKIVLIGAEGVVSHQVQTPLGGQHRAVVLAHIADNLLQDRWIHRFSYQNYTVMLLLVLLVALFLITQYPQSVALVLLLWLGLLTGALSVWVFDSHYYWLPLASPVLMIAVTWTIFVGYQANRLERKSWQLQQEQKYLSELEQLKNNFVSLISHDLKTPIAKIQSIVDRLLSQNQKEEMALDLRALRFSSEELHKYIQSILKVLRVESRDFRLHREICDINELVSEAIQILHPLAFEKSVELRSQLEPIFSIEADTTLMREVLVNLIENAIKYTAPGGHVLIKTKETENQVQVRIQDTGEGIPPEEVELVWKKFVRGREQDMKTKGTGLGLYLVKYFIELHGGSVHLESELKKGTVVSFSLPLENEGGTI